ncbi:MAG: hypothetical protein A2Z49_08200 [Chloroflexi bacterium RBG_19FT_COMBO_56_12]|nr:MAG: hypothetical protein A2Z49_08200 [Chloroflexi bacterium RBG_19FT_COMBO_56_12]
MIDQIITLPGIGNSPAATSPAVSQLRQEYTEVQTHFQAQPPNVQRFLEAQAEGIADAILQNLSQVRFNLPNQLDASLNDNPQAIPPEMRPQMVGTSMRRLAHKDLRTALRQTLLELEQSNLPAVSASAALLRYATATAMVHKLLPSGHTVIYMAAEDDTIPSIPVQTASASKSAIHFVSDTMVETGLAEDERSELQVPYVEAARRFYLPQWVAFDDQYQLLVGSLNEAKAHIASLQRYLFVLHAAVGLAPYMVADEDYQQKRYGVLGQLVNQGRALARYQVRKIIHTIQRRAAAQDLNRGLHLNLPYFDDQKLSIESYEFDVVPAGRVMFIPAFVVRAAHEQQVKVAQDTRLSPSTRWHLLTLLYLLGVAFYSSNGDSSQHNKG